MLASITPLGERSRRQRWRLTVAALMIGGAATGASAGAALAAGGLLLPSGANRRLELLLAVAAAALLLELLGFRVPTHRRQVDDGWLHRYRGWVYGLGFGGQLGVGISTIVPTAGVYVTLAAEALAPTLLFGAVIGGVFGLVRGSTLLATAKVDSPPRLNAFHQRFHAAEPAARWTAFAAQAAVLVAAVATL
jgi:hypothetical protein